MGVGFGLTTIAKATSEFLKVELSQNDNTGIDVATTAVVLYSGKIVIPVINGLALRSLECSRDSSKTSSNASIDLITKIFKSEN